MVAVGLKGEAGMLAALLMGAVVCTALSMAGSFITDLKIGYWLGTTPKKQETWKFLGTIVSAATVAGVMIVLDKTYGFKSGALAAPQANAMAAVIAPLMNGQGAPWVLYGIGAVIALILDRFKGGAVHSFIASRSKDEEVNKARSEKGTLIASGFIAGGALMGVVSALLKFGGVDFNYAAWWETANSEWLSLAAYLLLISIFILMTRPSKK